jgi:DNA-binding transcriptional LysR family regulator
MELDDVLAFVSVADTGSVSLAARNLNITQSAVTRRLQRLETSLGVEMLDRRTRPISLTTAGRAALDRCRRLLSDVQEVRAATANGSLPFGEIRIGVAHALTEVTLTKPVSEVGRMFPNLALRLRAGWSRDLLELVRTRAVDAAVILLPEGEPLPADVSGKEIGKDRLVVVAGRAKGTPRAGRLRDLAGMQWILNPEGCAARAALRKLLLQANVDMVVAVESYNYELQLALVVQGRGFSLVPEHILRRSRLRPQLRRLRISGLDFPLTVWMVFRELFTGFEPVIAELSRVLEERF